MNGLHQQSDPSNRSNSSIPPILYGTAWKESQTQRLVVQALTSGFKGIDTANQRKHYFEEGVGLGIHQFLKSSQTSRADLFLQTKFTLRRGQDHRLPYKESDPLTKQVQQSLDSSLKHLQTDYVDSYVLHGPTLAEGIIDDDLEIWQAMEALRSEGKVKFLCISNCSLQQLEELCLHVSGKPSFVQNRCFAINQWDQEIRLFCEKHQILYQGFSLLTANIPYLSNAFLQEIAQKHEKTIPQVIFRFAIQIGMLPLTGTTNPKHMMDDLAIQDFELTQEEIQFIEHIA